LYELNESITLMSWAILVLLHYTETQNVPGYWGIVRIVIGIVYKQHVLKQF